jgi:hypothetical protein
LYYAAGCRFFDVSADVKVLAAARKAAQDAYFCVSVAAPGDPHCKPVDLTTIPLDVDCIELHAAGVNENAVMERWNWLRENFNGLLSLCVSRNQLSDTQMLERVRACKPDIIQADGIAMSGKDDNFAATLQAIATAQILEKQPAYLILSGGTNTKTAELAHLCGVKAHGVAVGSFARRVKGVNEAKYLIEENLRWLNDMSSRIYCGICETPQQRSPSTGTAPPFALGSLVLGDIDD